MPVVNSMECPLSTLKNGPKQGDPFDKRCTISGLLVVWNAKNMTECGLISRITIV